MACLLISKILNQTRATANYRNRITGASRRHAAWMRDSIASWARSRAGIHLIYDVFMDISRNFIYGAKCSILPGFPVDNVLMVCGGGEADVTMVRRAPAVVTPRKPAHNRSHINTPSMAWRQETGMADLWLESLWPTIELSLVLH